MCIICIIEMLISVCLHKCIFLYLIKLVEYFICKLSYPDSMYSMQTGSRIKKGASFLLVLVTWGGAYSVLVFKMNLLVGWFGFCRHSDRLRELNFEEWKRCLWYIYKIPTFQMIFEWRRIRLSGDHDVKLLISTKLC